MEPSAANAGEERQPLNRPEPGQDRPAQAYPPVQSAANQAVQYPPPGPNQGPQYPQLPQYAPQGAPIAYQPMPMRPMQPAAYLPAAPQVVPLSPVTLWTRMPQATGCPYCQQNVTTTLVYNHCGSALPWLSCLGLFCSGFCLCCWVPFLCESCKDAAHMCPLCRRLLGKKGML